MSEHGAAEVVGGLLSTERGVWQVERAERTSDGMRMVIRQSFAEPMHPGVSGPLVVPVNPVLPPICATIEDVVRAAPVAGFYPVMPSPDWSRPAAPEWKVMRLTIRPAASTVPARRWWVLDDEGWMPEGEFIGWRIGPRIRMPGEAG